MDGDRPDHGPDRRHLPNGPRHPTRSSAMNRLTFPEGPRRPPEALLPRDTDEEFENTLKFAHLDMFGVLHRRDPVGRSRGRPSSFGADWFDFAARALRR